jgi:thioredoxin 1
MGLPELENKDSFDTVLKNAGKSLVVVDFYADWCGPCKRLAPHLEELNTQKTNVRFYKVNIEINEETTAEQQITAMPTIVFFKNGKRVHEVVGADFTKITEGVTKYE